jgi:hypothetical protein
VSVPKVLLDALTTAGCRPRNGSALCPAHEDHHPSLGFGVHKDGWAFVRCHAQRCDRAAILTELGLDWRALAPSSATRTDVEVNTVPKVKLPHDPEVLADWIADAHRRLIGADVAGPARVYLRSRGVTGEDVRQYRLGFAVEHPDRKLNRLYSRIVYAEWPWCAEGRLIPELKASTYRPERKYQTEGPKRAWGIAEVDPDWPVVLVEGPFDRIAVGRLAGPTQVIALCGSSGIHREDVSVLRTRGVTEVLVFLDADVDAAKLDRVMRDLSTGGIRPVGVTGLDEGDPGDLLPALTTDDDAAWSALSEALTTPQEPA